MATDKAHIAVKDPVCGMAVDPATAKHRRAYGGQTYYFCCQHCAEKFEAAPEKFLQAPARSYGLVTLGAKPVSARLSVEHQDRKSTRLNSSHLVISYAVFC